MDWPKKRASGHSPQGSNKYAQLAGIANFVIYSLQQKSCQVFFLNIRLDTGKWILSPSGITAVVLGGGGI